MNNNYNGLNGNGTQPQPPSPPTPPTPPVCRRIIENGRPPKRPKRPETVKLHEDFKAPEIDFKLGLFAIACVLSFFSLMVYLG